MAKRVSKRKQEKVLSPTELRRKMLVERKQREEQRAVLGILVPVLVLLVAFLAYGAYAELWREPRAPIARVEGETINAGRFQERIGWERVQLINSLESLRSLALSTDPSFINNMAAQQRSGLAQSTVDRMIDEALIRQEAEARGISVTEREVRNHIISTTLASILLATPEPVDEEPMTPIDEELDAADDAAAEDAAEDPAADDAAEDASSEEAEDEPADDPDASSEDDEAAEAAVAEAEDADEAADEGESSEQASEGDTLTGSEGGDGEETADDAASDEDAEADTDAEADEDSESEGAESEDGESADGADDEDETSSLPDKPTEPDEVSDEDFENAVENYLAGQFTTAGITRDDYFEIQRQAVYREKLNRALGEEIETTAPQIELDYLLFRDKATADAAAAALDAGQSWDEVVDEYGAPDEEDAEETGADEASEDGATEDEATADDEAAADEADASTADGVSEDGVSEDELSEDESTADEADAGDDTAEDEEADEPADDADAEDETAEDEDSMEADAEDETAADDEMADDETAADDEAADDETADDDADSEADEEEAEPTASPSPIPAPTAEPFAFETGERRWYSRQQALQRLGLNEATADTVMGLETDASSEAIQGSRGFYVFRAVDREEARQLEEGELDTLRSTAVDDWLEERRLTADIQRFAYEDKVPAEPDWFLNAYNQITGSNQAMPTLAMPEVVGTAVPAPVEQEAPAPAGGEDASGDG